MTLLVWFALWFVGAVLTWFGLALAVRYRPNETPMIKPGVATFTSCVWPVYLVYVAWFWAFAGLFAAWNRIAKRKP